MNASRPTVTVFRDWRLAEAYAAWTGLTLHYAKAPDSSAALVERLAWFMRAAQGTSIVALEETAVNLTLAHQRMLHRLALGHGGALVAAEPLGQNWPVGWPVPEPPDCSPASLATLAAGLEALRSPTLNFGPGIGCYPQPRALLVGDRPGPGWRSRYNWPFVSALRSGCSAWLAELLEMEGIPERELYWINAHDRVGDPTSAEFVEAQKPQVIVALGKSAAHWCADNRLTFTEVHHPQYWKRFHSHHRYHLLNILKRERT